MDNPRYLPNTTDQHEVREAFTDPVEAARILYSHDEHKGTDYALALAALTALMVEARPGVSAAQHEQNMLARISVPSLAVVRDHEHESGGWCPWSGTRTRTNGNCPYCDRATAGDPLTIVSARS